MMEGQFVASEPRVSHAQVQDATSCFPVVQFRDEQRAKTRKRDLTTETSQNAAGGGIIPRFHQVGGKTLGRGIRKVLCDVGCGDGFPVADVHVLFQMREEGGGGAGVRSPWDRTGQGHGPVCC